MPPKDQLAEIVTEEELEAQRDSAIDFETWDGDDSEEEVAEEAQDDSDGDGDGEVESSQDAEDSSEDESEEEEKREERFVKLDNGTVIKESEVTFDLFQKLATQANQVAHSQRLAEERGQQAKREAEARAQIEERLRAHEAAIRQAQEAQRQQAITVQQIPAEDVQMHFKPLAERAAKQGYFPEEFLSDYPGAVEGAMYHTDFVVKSYGLPIVAKMQEMEATIAYLTEKLAGIEQTYPDYANEIETKRAEAQRAQVFAEASSAPGYEQLRDPAVQQQVLSFIAEAVLGTFDKDEHGNPIDGTGWNPRFTPQFLQRQYRAMVAPSNDTITEGKKRADEAKKRQQAAARKAGGGAGSKPGAAKKRGSDRPMTEAEAAMDIFDPRAAF